MRILFRKKFCKSYWQEPCRYAIISCGIAILFHTDTLYDYTTFRQGCQVIPVNISIVAGFSHESPAFLYHFVWRCLTRGRRRRSRLSPLSSTSTSTLTSTSTSTLTAFFGFQKNRLVSGVSDSMNFPLYDGFFERFSKKAFAFSKQKQLPERRHWKFPGS